MEVVINGSPKEIAELAMELQNRLKNTTIESTVNLDGDSIFRAVERAIHGNAAGVQE